MKLRSILVLLAVGLALAGYFYYSNIPKSAPPGKTTAPTWRIEETELRRITIRLPQEDKSVAFARDGEEGPWRFDDPAQTPVNRDRWGGIPLLLQGPQSERIIARSVGRDKLAAFGLVEPRMSIALTLRGGRVLDITIGDAVPDSSAFYLRVPNTSDVAVVDYSWYQVFERLVREPPYPLPSPG